MSCIPQLAGLTLVFLFGFSTKISAQFSPAIASVDRRPVMPSRPSPGKPPAKTRPLTRMAEHPAPPPDSCGCLNCPGYMPDNFMDNFYFHVPAAANNDLADPAQAVTGVRLHFDHQYLGDLSMRLFSPAGQSVTLVAPVGFYGTTDFTDWEVSFLPCSAPAIPDPGFAAVWSNHQTWGMGGAYTGSYYPAASCLEDFNTGPVSGNWRLEIVDNQAVDIGRLYDFKVLFQDTAGLNCVPCQGPPTAGFSVDAGDWDVLLTNSSVAASTYQLDMGDGTVLYGTSLPDQHSYADTGTFHLQLLAFNLCGVDTFGQTVHVAGQLPSVNGIIADPGSGCAPLLNHYLTFGANHVDTWHWLMPGAIPAESAAKAPSVTYNEPGSYPVMLIISNQLGADTLQYAGFIEVAPYLTAAGCTVQVQGDSIIASTATLGYTQLVWSLNGKPADSSAAQQIFVVDSSGTYTVGLYLANACDTATVQQSVPVILSGLKNATAEAFGLLLAPNPNDGQCRLTVVSPDNLPAGLTVLNAAGQTVFFQKTKLLYGENIVDLDLQPLPPGYYLLRLQTGSGWQSIPFAIQH